MTNEEKVQELADDLNVHVWIEHKLTPEQKEKLLTNSYCCPFCSAGGYTFYNHSEVINDQLIERGRCHACNKAWYDAIKDLKDQCGSATLQDQHGNDVPTDLVCMPTGLDQIDLIDISLVDHSDWYEVDNVLLISAEAINHSSEVDPIDVGVKLDKKTKIMIIDPILHRWNPEDGFYHA